MTDKDLKKLGRADLVNLLLEKNREIETLHRQLDAAETALMDKTIKIQEAGSIAEASLMLNGVFQAAQQACQQYTDNIALLSQQQEMICAQRERESLEEAAQIIADAKKQAAEQEACTRMTCEEMLETAKIESRKYWDDVSKKLAVLANEYSEMRQLLHILMPLDDK